MFDCATSICSRLARLGLLFLAVTCLPVDEVQAHPEGFSGMHVKIDGAGIRAEITVHTRDLDGWFPAGLYPDYVADVTREMMRTVDEIVELQVDGETQPVEGVSAFLLEPGLIEIDVDFSLPDASGQVELLFWSKHLIRMPRGHQQLLFVEDRRQTAAESDPGIVLLDDLLSVERDAAAVIVTPSTPAETGQPSDVPPPGTMSPEGQLPKSVASRNHDFDPSSGAANATRRPIAAPAAEQPTSRLSFFLLGVEHIITGYDHLLFLAALLLACASFREAAIIITCFTIAHSITLAIAALDLVHVSSGIVEPLIALSIVYVAVENLSARPRLWPRAAITCFFGLIHGLGFASVLREMGLGTLPGGVLWPLVRFNLGVEAGQLCIAAVAFPCMLWAKNTKRYSQLVVPAGSSLVAVVGLYWLVTRAGSQLAWGH